MGCPCVLELVCVAYFNSLSIFNVVKHVFFIIHIFLLIIKHNIIIFCMCQNK